MEQDCKARLACMQKRDSIDGRAATAALHMPGCACECKHLPIDDRAMSYTVGLGESFLDCVYLSVRILCTFYIPM